MIDVPGPGFLPRLLRNKLDTTEIEELIKEFHLVSKAARGLTRRGHRAFAQLIEHKSINRAIEQLVRSGAPTA